MYDTLMLTVRRFLGQGVQTKILLILLAALALGLILWTIPAVRRWWREAQQRGGWRGLFSGLSGGAYKVALLLVVVQFLRVAMAVQADDFARQHGRITERNRDAVLMKWGSPHEQRELTVNFYTTRTYVTRQIKLPGEKGQIIEQYYWADEEQPLGEVDGHKPAVLRESREERRIVVNQQGIESADVDITVANNPRTLGGANYAGYDDTWQMRYTVTNRHDKPVRGEFTFPLPATTGVFDRMQLKLDGRDILPTVRSEGNALRWEETMQPGQSSEVVVAYQSRGLEHLRYIPRRMTQTGHYRVRMNVIGVPVAELDYPIGSMPPAEDRDSLRGQNEYMLTWDLDNAMTSYDIGIKMPVARQPQYHFASLLGQAPVGLVLLLILLVVPRFILARRIAPATVVLMLVAYYLFYTFMANFAGLVHDFTPAFLPSAVLLTGIVAALRLPDRDSRLLARQDLAAFALLVVLYPLAIIDTTRTDFWMQIFYTGILLYGCLLLGYRRHESQPPRAEGDNQDDGKAQTLARTKMEELSTSAAN